VKLDSKKLPKHLAIIMDGNGRWANQRLKPRTFGHRSALDSVDEIIRTCIELGIPYLTLYTFSTENWMRPKSEVSTLMELLLESLQKELKNIISNNIRLNTIGNLSYLPTKVYEALEEVKEQTKKNTSMVLTLALNYGAKEELVTTIKKIATEVKNKNLLISDIKETLVNKYLYTHDLPDVDLLIRTSGENRISNFLLWQIAYAELYFTETFWPDFKKENILEALIEYQNRERRFGKTIKKIDN